jgi:hypothetical protein
MAFSTILRSPFGALLAAALLAAACGSSPAHAQAGSSAGNSDLAQLDAYSKCMRSHGIKDFPDPVPNPGGQGGSIDVTGGPGSDLDRNDARFQAADQACKSLLPQPKVPAATRISAGVKLAACMRAHGFPSFPDPNSDGAFNFSGIDRTTSQFQSAIQTCRSATGYPQGPMPVGN